MNNSGQSSAYLRTEVLSSSPERLVPLLYEQLLVSLKRGAMYIRKEDIEGKFTSLAKASDIISELLSALDYEVGGELATRLSALYSFWLQEITVAGRELNQNRLNRVAEMVESLAEAWNEVARTTDPGGTPPPPSTPPSPYGVQS